MIEAFRNICLDYRYILERHLFNPSQEMNQKVVLTIMKEHKTQKTVKRCEIFFCIRSCGK